MNIREKQKEHAVKCIETLTKRYNLNPNLLKYFKEDKIYYTETIIPGIWASMDNITYDEKYVKAVRSFEKCYGALVYHAILTGTMFSMLYVGKDESDWEYGSPTPDSDWVMAAVYDMETGDVEIGDIKLSVASQTLVRVG